MRNKILFVILIFFAAGCGSSTETVIVTDNPVAPPETTITEPADQPETVEGETDSDFTVFRLGETKKINTLDPLFANNSAELRAVSLIFETLTAFNKDGDIVPGIAKRWEVGSDSLEYTFVLRGDLFFHDSSVFVSGLGRKLTASDIGFMFLRMARNNVPPKTAKNFFHIDGFEAYFNELHYQLDPGQHVIKGIKGIQLPNDSTVVIRLLQKDDNLLNKLAHPSASVYPRESINNSSGLIAKPVGSGAYTFIEKTETSLTLGRNPDYRRSLPANRIEITHGIEEGRLYQQFARQEIDLLPELTPEIITNVSNPDNRLKVSFQNTFNLLSGFGEFSYSVNKNNSSSKRFDPLLRTLFDSREVLSQGRFEVNITEPVDTTALEFTYPDQYLAANTKDPFILHLYSRVNTLLEEENSTIRLTDVRIPYSVVDLYGSDINFEDGKPLMTIHYPRLALTHENVQGIELNQKIWWMDISGYTKEESN